MPDETVTEIEERAAEKKQEHREDQTTISEYLESLLVTVILALFGTSFIVQAFKIPSASMEGTLLIGDHLLVNKFIFGGTGAWYDKLAALQFTVGQNFLVPGARSAENELIYQQVVANEQSAFHGSRGDLEGLNDKAGTKQGQNRS